MRIVYRANRIPGATNRHLASRKGDCMTFKKPPSRPRRNPPGLSRSRSQDPAAPWSPARRGFLARTVAALSASPFVFPSSSYANTMKNSDTDAVLVAAAPATRRAADGLAIRPFTFHASQAELDELRRRVAGTRFPEKETVADASQGVQLATVQK